MCQFSAGLVAPSETLAGLCRSGAGIDPAHDANFTGGASNRRAAPQHPAPARHTSGALRAALPTSPGCASGARNRATTLPSGLGFARRTHAAPSLRRLPSPRGCASGARNRATTLPSGLGFARRTHALLRRRAIADALARIGLGHLERLAVRLAAHHHLAVIRIGAEGRLAGDRHCVLAGACHLVGDLVA